MTRVPFKWAWSRYIIAIFPGFVASMLFGALFATVEGGTVLLVAQRVSCAVGGVVSATIALRFSRFGVLVSDETLEIRNVFSTRRLRWSDVVSFTPPAEYGTLRKAGMRVNLRTGESVSVTAISRGMLEGDSGTRDFVERMNLLLQQHSRH